MTEVFIPRANAAPLGQDGRWRTEWYTFLSNLAKQPGTSADIATQLSSLAARVTTLENESDFLAELIGTGSVRITGSLAAGAVVFSLVNDESAPSASYYYGTDSLGLKGWHVLNAGVVPYDNAISGLSATDVQAAIDELAAEKLDDAPSDGQEYVRKNGDWEVATGGGGGGSPAYIYTYANPAFSKVVALLPFDGTNGSTTITDYAPMNSWLVNGGASLSTADKVFGTASLLVPSGSNSCIYTNTHSGWNFGTQDFAIEFRVKKNGAPETSARIFQTRNGDIYGGISLLLNATGLELYMSSTGSSFNLISDASAATIDTVAFNDCVLQRRGGVIELFVGVKFKKSWAIGTSASLYYNAADQIIIGGNRTGTSRSINAYLDNFRVTVGAYVLTPVAEYEEPTSAFPTS